ncbi:hypothetical protein [Collimonas sp.]|jgi:hypothetical protein|uniref:hypothetical protein n=1 Tax=Collimonas sp. TaxID=1963772 RepID=UPI002B9BF2B6|nr:hypothetical protein [Collimonas sp.]HWW99632.1 hypothetical protein [Collimonas sp.]
MSRATLAAWLLASCFFLLVFSAYAICNDDDSYAAPTLRDLCEAHGWPDDENSKMAFRRACQTELKRSQ